MLVLERKVGESICIGEDVVMTVIEFRPGRKVVLGFTAPKEVHIDRGEVREKINQDGRRPRKECDGHTDKTVEQVPHA